MIELCDIFSLDSPTRQQVLFVRQSFNLSSFRAICVPAIFYGSRSDSFKFSVSLSAWRVAEVCSHSFQIKIVCFERLIGSLDSVFGNAWHHYVTYRNEVDIGPPYLYFDENRSNAFLFTSKGLTLEGFTTFMDCCLKEQCHEDCAVLGQFCAKIITLRL